MRFTTLPESDHAAVVIRPLERADIADWFAYLSRPSVFEHTSWNVQSVDELMHYADAEAAQAPAALVRFALAARDTNALIGTAGFHTVSPANRSAEIAYDLHPDHWGRGIASTVCARLTAWAIAEADLLRVQATVLQSNLRSVRVLERAGFQREGLLRCYRQVRGTPGDFWMYSKLACSATPS
jgi:[ribosomal protein S5]-alanine N-acetyltransferase